MLKRMLVPVAVLLALVPGPASADPDAALRIAPEDAAKAYGAAAPRAVAVYDVSGGRFLLERSARAEVPVASLMKMVAALVVAERAQPDEVVRISARAAGTAHDRLQWRQGASFTVNEVLHGMMLESSNGAAIALAEHVGGSVPGFARLANARLAQLGASGTTLVDPSGLDAPGQRSNARDMALVAAAVLQNEWLADIVSTRSFELPWPDGGRATFGNINEYVRRDPTAVGVKNGFTSSAGNTLAAASTRRGRTHVVIVLHSGEIYDTAKRLMDLAFEVAPGTGSTLVAGGTAAAVKQEEAMVTRAVADPASAGDEAPETTGGAKSPLRWPLAGLVVLAFLRLRKTEIERRLPHRVEDPAGAEYDEVVEEPAMDDYEVIDPWGEVLTYAELADDLDARARRRRISNF